MKRESEIAKLQAELRRWSLALQSLTPGGSEYVDDPELCVKFARNAREHNFELARRAFLRAKKAEAKLEQFSAESRAAARNDFLGVVDNRDLAQLRERLRWRKPEEEAMPHCLRQPSPTIECIGVTVPLETPRRFIACPCQCSTGYFEPDEHEQIRITYWRPLDAAPEESE